MSLEDQQAEIAELRALVANVTEALENAESCETKEDFRANIEEAVSSLTTLLGELRELAS